MWEMFDELTLQGFTLARIRKIFAKSKNPLLEKLTDIPLLQRMIRVYRAYLPEGTV